MKTPQFILPLDDGLVVDLFAGGGGASSGIERALGRHVDIAINHNPKAVGMHRANHPQAEHFCCDVFEVDPVDVCRGRPVDHLHASPDCTHFSQAKGGQPRSAAIRALAWVIHRWAGKVRPRVITMENVEQMLQWSSLIAKRDPATGRVVTLDKVVDPVTGKNVNRIANKGEVVPRNRQWLVPNPKKKGRNWNHFVEGLRAMGGAVQWKVICNANKGARSTRERLYVIVRFDGEPIVWPEDTHAKPPKNKRAGRPLLKPWKPAADCIDWSIPGKTIFGRKKPLADATLRRVATGLVRFVLDSPDPFIVNNMANNVPRPVTEPMAPVLTGGHKMLVAPSLMPITHVGADRVHSLEEPMRTVTTAHRGEFALASATLVQMGYGEREGQSPRALDLQMPLGTVVAGGQKHGLVTACMVQASHGEGAGATKRRSCGAKAATDPLGTVTGSGSGGQAVASAFMVQANGGFYEGPGHDLRRPMSTVTTSGSQQQLIAAHLTALRRNSNGRDVRDPLPTVSAGGEHQALVEYHLSKDHEEGALRCAAFLMRYHGDGGQWADLRDPMTTVTTKDRLALVTVWVKGEPYVIVDICLRMLVPRELFNAQGFAPDYIIDHGFDKFGKRFELTKTDQVLMVGNSVDPGVIEQLVAANHPRFTAAKAAA